MVLLASVVRFAYGDQKASIRLAIMDVDHAKPVPSAFLDILLIELSRRPEIALLEREEIALILKEQVLNLSLTGDLEASAIVKSGQILAADVILMLKNEGDAEAKIDLRLRLVDARHGLKLLDSNQSVESKPAGYEGKAQLIAASVLQHIKRTNVDPDQLLLIGVSTFKSEGMAKRWDWLSDVVPGNIEQNLALYPGVCLVERTVAKPLIDERDVSSGLPESITASAILLDGAYRIDRTKDAILLFIRAKRDRQSLFEMTIEGSLNKIEQLCEKAAKTVMEKVRSGPVKKSMDTAIEAKMLKEEATTYLSRKEYSRALRPAESAYALMPQAFEYPELIIRALMGSELSPQAMGGKEQARLAKSRFRVLNLAERIIRTCPLPSDKNLAQELDQDLAYLHMHSYAMEKGFTAMAYGTYKMKEDERSKGLYAELSRNFWHLFEVCHDRYAGKSDRLHERLLYRGSWAFNRVQNIDEAIRTANNILTHQVKLNADLYAIRGFLNAVRSNWQDNDEALKKAGNFLATLQQSSNREVRLEALEYGIQFYSEISLNHEQVRSLGKEYAEFCKIAGNPDPKPVTNKPFFPDEKDSEIFESELLADIIDFSLQSHSIRMNTPFWSDSTVRLADLLEKQGRSVEAITYLRKMTGAFDNHRDWKWHTLQDKINEIQEKHPEIEIPDAHSASDQFNPVLVFSVRDKTLSNRKVNDIRFRRFGVDDGQVIIVFSAQHGERYGVLRLDRRNQRLLAIQSLEAVKEFKSRVVNDYWEYNRGPAVTVRKGDVYLGFMHAGFLVFRHNGTIIRLNEENGLAYNNIRYLECLGDKILAHVGVSRSVSGLMELDLRTGHSKIITSTRVEKAKCELDHRTVGGIAPDPHRGVLWVLSGNMVNTGHDWNRLYRYDPTSGDFQRVVTPELDRFLQETSHPDKTHGLRMFGDSLLIFNGRGLCEFNLTSQQTTTLVYNYRDAKWSFPWRIDPTITFALVEEGLVCVSSDQLLYFQDGKKEPNHISKRLFKELKSDKLEVRELVPTEEGLYVLCPNALYLIAKINSRPGSGLNIQRFSLLPSAKEQSD